MMTGKEINFRTGLTIMFSSPSVTPATAYSFMPPLNTNPATNHEAAYKATELPKILIRNLIMNYADKIIIKLIKFQISAFSVEVSLNRVKTRNNDGVVEHSRLIVLAWNWL